MLLGPLDNYLLHAPSLFRHLPVLLKLQTLPPLRTPLPHSRIWDLRAQDKTVAATIVGHRQPFIEF